MRCQFRLVRGFRGARGFQHVLCFGSLLCFDLVAGTLMLLGHVALGFLSLIWLQRRSTRITEGSWPILLRQLCGQLCIRRPVTLLSSPRRTMPMTWGLWRTRL